MDDSRPRSLPYHVNADLEITMAHFQQTTSAGSASTACFLRHLRMVSALAVTVAVFAVGLAGAFRPSMFRPVAASPDVVSGEPADPGEYPWQVYILVGPPDRVRECGGSLIHPQWVVTAASCFFDEEDAPVSSPIGIVLGDHDISRDEGVEQFPEVDEIIINDRFFIEDPDAHYDIALLSLRHRAVLSHRVFPIPVVESPTDDHLVKSRLRATLTGWGGTNLHDTERSTILQELEYTMVLCGLRHDVIQYICLQTGGAGSYGMCTGDKGGPLMVKTREGEVKLAGVASHNTGEGCGDGDDIYSHMSFHRSWIQEITGGALDWKPARLVFPIALNLAMPRPAATAPTPTPRSTGTAPPTPTPRPTRPTPSYPTVTSTHTPTATLEVDSLRR